MGILRSFINSQRYLSRNFDKLLPEKFVIDGNNDFIESFVPKHLLDNSNVYDIGGGKKPFMSPEEKRAINAKR